MDHLINIFKYMVDSFIHAWPYLLLTIPISVAVKMSGASKYINKAFTSKPVTAVFLSTFVGAFSPLCSCTVIPVIASLLIGGVPIAPVMSFWLASPSMDPEIFFLTVSSLGWELAAWRLSATLVLSLGGGLLTLLLSRRGWLGGDSIRNSDLMQIKPFKFSIKKILTGFSEGIKKGFDKLQKRNRILNSGINSQNKQNISEGKTCVSPSCCGDKDLENKCCDESSEYLQPKDDLNYFKKLLYEILSATQMVAKFMFLAWFLGAIINLYIPESFVTKVLGSNNPFSVLIAAVLGIPAYTSSFAALPLIGGLLDQGMYPAAALAFLIAGPTTTLPAMSAVWGLVNRKVFLLYVGFSLFGAIILGFFYGLFI